MGKIVNKTILCDVDGVLLEWHKAFVETSWWQVADEKQYDLALRFNKTEEQVNSAIEYFNNSSTVANLLPIRNAVKYVRQLFDEGYRFHVITSMTSNEAGQRHRLNNLKNRFGDVFDRFTFLPLGASKYDVLKEYEGSGCFWIEDNLKNAEDGISLGLKSILLDTPYNKSDSDIHRVKNWKEIYDTITCK